MSRLEIDGYFWLCGDEDSGVSVHCRACDREGLPIIYYSSDANDISYRNNPDVVRVYEVSHLFTAGTKHVARHRASQKKHAL